jgi:hypothetical protein
MFKELSDHRYLSTTAEGVFCVKGVQDALFDNRGVLVVSAVSVLCKGEILLTFFTV